MIFVLASSTDSVNDDAQFPCLEMGAVISTLVGGGGYMRRYRDGAWLQVG